MSKKSSSLSEVMKRELIYLKRAEQDLEEMFNNLTSSCNELQIAALNDQQEHLMDMLVELQRSFAGK